MTAPPPGPGQHPPYGQQPYGQQPYTPPPSKGVPAWVWVVSIPVVIALLTWGVSSVVPGPAGDGAWLVVLGVIATPVILLLAGCVLMIPDRLRGWGVACLVAGGLWLISSAGVCTALVFGFAQMYQNDSSGVLL